MFRSWDHTRPSQSRLYFKLPNNEFTWILIFLPMMRDGVNAYIMGPFGNIVSGGK